MVATRGTTNRNVRGNTVDRLRRRQWLVETYRSDYNVSPNAELDGHVARWPLRDAPADSLPTCRCYRCGTLLTLDTVTVDRIIPGCQGGTYRRTNIRPACSRCNSETGATVRSRP